MPEDLSNLSKKASYKALIRDRWLYACAVPMTFLNAEAVPSLSYSSVPFWIAFAQAENFCSFAMELKVKYL